MALGRGGLGLAGQDMLAELTAMLAAVTGEDEQWAAGITAACALEGDLRLDSLEFAALGELLRAAYGDRVDLLAFAAGLDIDQLIALTVGEVAAYVTARTAASLAGTQR
jgi:acyl carrier protein